MALTELPSMRAVICGPEGSWKSSMGLTWPRPLRHFDIDIGGFRRATWCDLPQPRIDLDGIESKSYRVEIGTEKFLSAPKGQPTVKFPKRVTGYREVWQDIIVDFVAACQDHSIKTIQLDSATGLWDICHRGFLQEKQEIQLAQGIKENDKKFRERLQPVEFPNDRMNQLVYTAQSYDKNLILIHYPKDEYGLRPNKDGDMEEQKTGKLIIDGFKHTEKIVDIVIWTELKEFKTNGDKEWRCEATIRTKCGVPGLGTAALGWELPTPDYQGLITLYKMINGIEEE